MPVVNSEDYPTKEKLSCIGIDNNIDRDTILMLLKDKILHKDIIPFIISYLFPEIYADYDEKERKIYLSRTLHFDFNSWAIRTICYSVDKDHNIKHDCDIQCGYMDTITKCYKCGNSNTLSKKCPKCLTEMCPPECDSLFKIHVLLKQICPTFVIEPSLDKQNRFKYIKVINIDHIWVNMLAKGTFVCDFLIVNADGVAQLVWFLYKPKCFKTHTYEYIDKNKTYAFPP